jgi:hypothetical protein
MAWRFRTPWSSRDAPNLGIEGISRSNSETEVTPTSSEKKGLDGQDVDITAAAEDLPKFAKTHQFDPMLPQDKIDILHDATATGDVEAMKVATAAFAEDSPYAEVKASVRPIDGSEPANTVRAWILGMIFVTVASGLNMFLSMRFVLVPHFSRDTFDQIYDRSPAISFPPVVILL